MSQLTIDSELKRVLGIQGMTTEELNAIQWNTKTPATVIRDQIQIRCDALGLTEAQADEARAAGLEPYWRDGRSIAWCVSRGSAKANMLAKAGVL